MRGFARRTEVEEALRLLDEISSPLSSEDVDLVDACGRVLTTDLVSANDIPSFDRSAMDGYAVVASDTFGASSFSPIRLELVGEAYPARPADTPVSTGKTIRIMTGSPIPPGADAVLMAEHAEERDGSISVAKPVEPGKNVSPKGEDVRVGDRVLRRGRRLRPQDVALAGSLGHSVLPVVRRPRVVILGTGDELLPAGSEPRAHHVIDSNSVMLAGLTRRDGGEVIRRDIVPDDRSLIEDALSAPSADVILVSGGSSVGLEDHAPTLLDELGELIVHGVAMRPASPAGFGRIGRTLVFLLPGNPVSCLCAYDFFAGRAIRILGGRTSEWPYRELDATLRRKVASAVGRVDYVRMKIEGDEAEPIATGGASILSSTTRADGFLIVDADSEGYAAGRNVQIWLYDE